MRAQRRVKKTLLIFISLSPACNFRKRRNTRAFADSYLRTETSEEEVDEEREVRRVNEERPRLPSRTQGVVRWGERVAWAGLVRIGEPKQVPSFFCLDFANWGRWYTLAAVS